MASKKGARRASFLDDYKIDDRMVLRPDRKAGISGIYSGFDADGSAVLIRFWPKVTGAPDEDLREIWRHEIRQLHRLGGYPGASRSIAVLQHAGEDPSGFFLVLRPGQRVPLASLLERPPPGTWLASPRVPGNRARLWRNLKQVSEGLEILHSQGLLHRNLDAWSVLGTASDETDFQLTGFEWSFRVMAAAAPAKKAKGRSVAVSPQPASFLEDWKAFGRLAAQVLKLAEPRLMDLGIAASDVSEAVTVEEIRLIRHLLHAEPLDRIDGEIVGERIDQILDLLGAEVAGRDPKLHLVVQLGPNSRLAQQVAEASDYMAGVGETDLQRAFIADDLRERAMLIGIRNPQTGDVRFAIQGGKLLYALEPYSQPGSVVGPSWEFAFCQRAEGGAPPASIVASEDELAPESLVLLLPREARDSFPRLRGKLSSWGRFEQSRNAKAASPSPATQLHRALALTQHLEALFAAADAFPVETRGPSQSAGEDGQRLFLQLRPDPDREALSTALDLRAPAVRLREALADDRRSDEWILTEAHQLGRRDLSETRWRFVAMQKPADAPEVYEFVGPESAPALRNPVLIAGDSVGQDIQFRRRLKALRALSDHEELLGMLSAPRFRVLDSQEPLTKDKAFEALDESKQRAFEAIVGTLPLFLVQGPPGVGKTRLVRDLVCGGFRDDAAGRVLLSAQSNAAVDHLMDEVAAGLSAKHELLIVRCRPPDGRDDVGPFEVGQQAQAILAKLAASEMAQHAPIALRESVQELAARAAGGVAQTRGGRYAMRAFESLVVRAANAVFTTTNSQELERLIEERGQFDWAIVEEAGKATGGELLSPLLLSHRRLMIGDHKQLAPFNSERIVRLLERPDQVAIALEAGEGFIAAFLRDPSTDEVLDELEESEKELPELCATSLRGLLLFEQLIEDEFSFQSKRPQARKIAHRLEQQHRMHPSIARIVSHAFYDDALKSHTDTEARFAAEPSPVLSADTKRLPNLPVVVVGMPWVQAEKHSKATERYPVWHNSAERAAVAAAADLLRVAPGLERPPSLAILSPYGEQVRRLKGEIDDHLSEFSSLSGFRPAVGPGQYCGTVDSFQGNEADVVIISLVRNNHHSGALSALGFLSDPRRMNVLLSRARWRTILVGSIEFLENVLKTVPVGAPGPDLRFLRRFLEGLRSETEKGEAICIPVSRLLGGSSK